MITIANEFSSKASSADIVVGLAKTYATIETRTGAYRRITSREEYRRQLASSIDEMRIFKRKENSVRVINIRVQTRGPKTPPFIQLIGGTLPSYGFRTDNGSPKWGANQPEARAWDYAEKWATNQGAATPRRVARWEGIPYATSRNAVEGICKMRSDGTFTSWETKSIVLGSDI